ncbi:gluconate 2-dehydrogenase subunit 3 family protein [Phyllobacterium salinisoli]|uniref:Gluconate 2-dehydrogenase subunit 3 family protein n=1 Tax=Phyllobacterium salinisoli TaxID=1899321 RepID=A0A368K2F6_9HYPH|nr:gluconate 2-dehydrogenase subunit 3 family protein [Phyllobacterium salinisoli]RCS22160.1 gluconate 2-dehydrogenase subunit 3 family protein [Phyllobacterium salinisoli]
MKKISGSTLSRRQFLASTVVSISFASTPDALARSFSGQLPWSPFAADPPTPARPGPWLFFTHDEAQTIEAIVDRLIPGDDLSVGGKAAGCAVFIDRQLAGFFGSSERLYMKGPFVQGLPQQGLQSPILPSERYRAGIATLDDYCSKTFSGRTFPALAPKEQDEVLQGLEKGSIDLGDADAKTFFELVLQNTMEGFFADPIYGGNKDMASWKMIGFPGARYDYRDFVNKHNQRYPLPPVSIMGRDDWGGKG